jgi:hypothetical protein
MQNAKCKSKKSKVKSQKNRLIRELYYYTLASLFTEI